MGGLLGLSGNAWSLVIQLMAFAIVFLIGLLGFRGSLLIVALALGVPANVIGQIVFAGGGPSACVGFVGIPLWCLASGWAGGGVWWLMWGRKLRLPVCENCGAPLSNEFSSSCTKCGKPARCRFCGYNLTGNESGRCPECGRLLAEMPEEDQAESHRHS